MALRVDVLPRELVTRRQWVAWRYERRNGKLTKPPVSPHTGGLASSTDPATWGTFAEAVRRCDKQRLAGVGFVVTLNDPIMGIDLDACLDPETGELAPWAHDFFTELRSYTEVTPSGHGVRILVRASLPSGGRRRGRIEMYDRARFFTVTGRRVAGMPPTIEARQAEVNALHSRVFDRRTESSARSHRPVSPNASDPVVLTRALSAKNGGKFARLWRGEWEDDYPSQSEADLALVSMLAFWTVGDAGHIDALFRRSGLFRPKWDERHFGDNATYGERTIAVAIDGHLPL